MIFVVNVWNLSKSMKSAQPLFQRSPQLFQAAPKAGTSTKFLKADREIIGRMGRNHAKSIKNLPSLQLTYWNTSFLLGNPIFRGYVSFREGTTASTYNIAPPPKKKGCKKGFLSEFWDGKILVVKIPGCRSF